MRSLSALVALLATSGSLASPIKARSPKVVEVFEYVTVVDVVTVTASPAIVTTVHVDDIVTEPPVVVYVTAAVQETVSAAPVPESPVPENPVPSAANLVVVTTSVVEAAPQFTILPAVASPNTPVASNEPWGLTVQHGLASILPAPEPASTLALAITSQASPAPSPSTTTQVLATPEATTAIAALPSTPLTEPAPVAATSAQPSLDANFHGLPTHTIIQNLQPTDTTYKNLALYSHNIHRQNHTNTKNLVYNDTLESYAKEKAQGCLWDEDLPSDADAAGVGMNMAEGTFIGAANVTTIISDMWYNGEIDLFPGYGIENPDMSKFDDWGHYTQVVWRDTKSVGCWSSPCSRKDGAANEIGSGFFTVCMYYPPANIGGEYADQVGTPEGKASVTGV